MPMRVWFVLHLELTLNVAQASAATQGSGGTAPKEQRVLEHVKAKLEGPQGTDPYQ